MNSEDKTTTATFRTSQELKDKLQDLADRIDQNYWNLSGGYRNNPKRNCRSLSGLIHEILSGTVTVQELEDELQEIEKKQEEA